MCMKLCMIYVYKPVYRPGPEHDTNSPSCLRPDPARVSLAVPNMD
jgi:hypothetical protein